MHIYFRFKKYIIYDSILSRMINTTPKYNYNIYMCIYIYIYTYIIRYKCACPPYLSGTPPHGSLPTKLDTSDTIAWPPN